MEKKKMALMTLMMIMLMVMSITVTSEAAVRVSGKDTNASKQCWTHLSKKKVQKQYQKHKIFVKNIEVSHWNDEMPTGTYTFTWDKAPYAKGYQIEVKSDAGIIQTNVTKNKFVLNASGSDYTSISIRVRPYTKVKGKKTYGKWSGVYGADRYCAHCAALNKLQEMYGEESQLHMSELEGLMLEYTNPK